MRRPNSSGRPGPSPFQNGILPGSPGAGLHKNPVMGDVHDAPGGSAEDEGLVGVGLKDHLFVEFANAHRFALGVCQEDAVQAAVGDGSGIQDGKARGAVAGRHDVADAVPGEARAKLGELVGGITAAEQVEDSVEGGPGKSAERSGTADKIVEGVNVDFRLRVFRHLALGHRIGWGPDRKSADWLCGLKHVERGPASFVALAL